MEARPRARRRSLDDDRRSPRRRRVGRDGRPRHRLAPSHRLASSVARLLAPDTLPRALGQPRQLSPALQEGRPDRATARNHAGLDAAAAALTPGKLVGRDSGAACPDCARNQQEARARPRSVRRFGHGRPDHCVLRTRVDRRGARSAYGPGHGAAAQAQTEARASVRRLTWPPERAIVTPGESAVRAAGRRGAGAPPAEARLWIAVRAAGRRGAGAPPAEARQSIEVKTTWR